MYILYHMNCYTIDRERFAGLNIHGFSAIEIFTEIFSRYLGHKCSLFSTTKEPERCLDSWKNFHSSYSWKPWMPRKFNPANLSPFMVLATCVPFVHVYTLYDHWLIKSMKCIQSWNQQTEITYSCMIAIATG